MLRALAKHSTRLPLPHPLLRVSARGLLKIVPEYVRGVRLALGKFSKPLSAGLWLNVPIYHKCLTIDMRDHVLQLPKQETITYDNVTIQVDTSIQVRVVNSNKALLNVSDIWKAIGEKCQMQLRDVLSSMKVNDILHKRDKVCQGVIDKLASIEEDWGVKVLAVQLKDISFDESMKRAMATKAEADRQAEAKVINAEADVSTAEMYKKAAAIYAENPVTLRLREFQLWSSVATNPNSTIFVVPSNVLDFVKPDK